MGDKKISDITLEALVSITDEIKGLREDTNRRFEQMDRRFERIEQDIAQIRQDISHIVARLDRDLLLIASDVQDVKRRLNVCEQNLGIHN